MSAPRPLTAADLREIEERANAANAGPWHAVMPQNTWHVRTDDGGYILEGSSVANRGAVRGWQADAEFIAHAREDVPRLVATVKALRELLHRSYHCESVDGEEDDAYTPWTWHEIDRALSPAQEAAP